MTWYSWSPCREISCWIIELDYYGLHTHGYHSITHWNEYWLRSIWLWWSHVCMKAHSHRNTQGNDMPLSEFSSVLLQTKMKHVIHLLWSHVVHLGMYWWLESPVHSWTAWYPHFQLKHPSLTRVETAWRCFHASFYDCRVPCGCLSSFLPILGIISTVATPRSTKESLFFSLVVVRAKWTAAIHFSPFQFSTTNGFPRVSLPPLHSPSSSWSPSFSSPLWARYH